MPVSVAELERAVESRREAKMDSRARKRARRPWQSQALLFAESFAATEAAMFSAVRAVTADPMPLATARFDRVLADGATRAIADLPPASIGAKVDPVREILAAEAGIRKVAELATGRDLVRAAEQATVSILRDEAMASTALVAHGKAAATLDWELSTAAGMTLLEPMRAAAQFTVSGGALLGGARDWPAVLGPELSGFGDQFWEAVAPPPVPSWLAPGSADADLFLLLPGESEPEEQLAALERMVDRVQWVPRGAAWSALCARAQEEETSPAEIKRRELRAAVLLVLGAVEKPQYHRFGSQWIVGASGRKELVRPYYDFDLDLLWEWFLDEVPKAAEAALLERPYPATGDPLEPNRDRSGRVISIESDRLVDPAGDPLLLLLDWERQSHDAARLRAALQLATPRQLELLTLIHDGDSPTEAGRRLGMAPGTVRTQLYRLRQKVV